MAWGWFIYLVIMAVVLACFKQWLGAISFAGLAVLFVVMVPLFTFI